MHTLRLLKILLGPLGFLIILLIPSMPGFSPEGQKVIAVAFWMIQWWISEAVPLPVTALVSIICFPLLNILTIQETTNSFGNPIIFLFMGGFMLALALEKWNLHRRISLNIIRLTGTNANGIVLGFMLATASLSMWISNTATTVMMLPIAQSVIALLALEEIQESQGFKNFALTLMLGVAYAANIGGIATLIGTPPNSVLATLFFDRYQYEISFGQWIAMGFPFSLLLLLLTYIILTRGVYPNRLGKLEGSQDVIEQELNKLGAWSPGEKRTLWVFCLTAFLWIFRTSINQVLPAEVRLNDTIIAMAASVSLFVMPVPGAKSDTILEWEDTRNLPWGILLLFGGGIALAGAMNKSGIIDLVAHQVSGGGAVSIFFILAGLTFLSLMMTEVMSNVALVSVLIPVIMGIGEALNQNPLWLAIPVTMASSCAFMLPMSTPPNAIVFASGYIKVFQMVRVGVFLNILAVILIVFTVWYFVPYVFGIELNTLPFWANP